MLPAVNRLASRKDIKQTLKQGAVMRSSVVNIYVHPRPAGKPSRFACVAGKKVHSQAVKRHLYQRRLRHAARQILPRLKSSSDIVLVAQPGITKIGDTEELRARIELLLKPLVK